MRWSILDRWSRAALMPFAFGLATVALAMPPDTGAIRDAAALVPIDDDGARIIVLGELHGTRETPALAEALVRRLAERGEPVTLALEAHASEQSRIDAFLASSGDTASRSELQSGPFWAVQPGRSDGRRSVALLDLLDAVRRLRGDGAALRVLAFDAGNAGAGADERNRRMAARLREAVESDSARRFVVLIGNYHARRAPPTNVVGLMPGQAPPVPTFAHLADLSMLRINVSARAGEFWACMAGTCGPRPVGARGAFGGATIPDAEAPAFHRTPDDATGGDAQLRLPTFSVAAPAVPSR